MRYSEIDMSDLKDRVHELSERISHVLMRL
jgi:hypothetical protein